MATRLIISAIAPNQPGMANRIASLISDAGATISESHMSVMANEFAIIMEVAGAWNSLAKLEHQLPFKAQQLGMLTTLKRSEKEPSKTGSVAYRVIIVAIEDQSLISDLTQFFAENDINIEEMNCRNFLAPHDAAAMSEVKLAVTLAPEQDVVEISSKFEQFCISHQLEGTLSPLKIS